MSDKYFNIHVTTVHSKNTYGITFQLFFSSLNCIPLIFKNSMVSVSNYFSIQSVSFLEIDIQKLIEFIVSPKRTPKYSWTLLPMYTINDSIY